MQSIITIFFLKQLTTIIQSMGLFYRENDFFILYFLQFFFFFNGLAMVNNIRFQHLTGYFKVFFIKYLK